MKTPPSSLFSSVVQINFHCGNDIGDVHDGDEC